MSNAEPELLQFKLRISPELKQRIERAAASTGRSVNRESITRLEASLDRDGGDKNSANAVLLAKIAAIFAAASEAAGSDWTDDRSAWQLVRSSVDHLLQGYEPWDDDDEELSSDAAEIFQRWKSATGAGGKNLAEVQAELRELKLREEVIGLSAEELERQATLRAISSRELKFEGLSTSDRKLLKKRIRAEEVRAKFWQRIAPVFAGPPGKEKMRSPGAI